MPNSDVIKIEREIAAPPARVFEAWTKPEVLRKWIWAGLGREVQATIDLRVGGTVRADALQVDGSTLTQSGTYRAIERDRRLEFTIEWSAPMGYASPLELCTVELSPYDGGTRMIFMHEGVPDEAARAEHRRGWEACFRFLAEAIGERQR